MKSIRLKGFKLLFMVCLVNFFICSSVFIPSSNRALAQTMKDRTAKLIEGAKKERQLTWYGMLTVDNARTLINVFEAKYPFLKVAYYRSASTRVIARVLAEQRANNNVVDVIMGMGTVLHFMQQKGLLAKYLSPERKYFTDSFKDKEGYWTDVYPTVQVAVYNTRMVKPKDVPSTWQDLLKPEWKGRIGYNPNSTTWLESIFQIMGEGEGLKYLKALARQNPSIRPGSSLCIILTGAGEFPIATPVNAHSVDRQIEKGAPVEQAMIKPYYGELHPISMAAKAPHPNAAKLLIDFVLSQEGQELVGKMGYTPSRKGLNPKIALEDINIIDPAFGEKIDYYQRLISEVFVNK